MNLKEWAKHVHTIAREHGWHDERMLPRERIAVYLMNLHSEISEAWEAFREGRLYEPCDKPIGLKCIEEELADIVIRAFDTAEAIGVDIERAINKKSAYNATRPHRHGGKLA